jgi:hypothetical protein
MLINLHKVDQTTRHGILEGHHALDALGRAHLDKP